MDLLDVENHALTLLQLKRSQNNHNKPNCFLPVNQKCPKCTNKPETVEENQQTSILPSVLPKQNNAESTRSTATDTKDHIDILEEKRAADEQDRVCPICGQIFSTAVRFEDFVRHVELHFIDEDAGSESDISLENNYEFVSNTIGNF